jgi:hypothetical protein
VKVAGEVDGGLGDDLDMLIGDDDELNRADHQSSFEDVVVVVVAVEAMVRMSEEEELQLERSLLDVVA